MSSQKSKIIFRRPGMPKECVQEIEVKKNTHYLPEKRCSSGYVSGDLKLACQRNESLSDGWGKKNYPAPLN
jgi:hypothetical protein